MSLPYIRGSSTSSYNSNSNNKGTTSGSSSMVRNSAYRDRAEENSMTLMEMEMENNQKWVPTIKIRSSLFIRSLKIIMLW
jgi:hypothetical protein